ncbi:hypothetical protein [Rubrivirga sp. IMCC43871]|uniref:hypothetical protein n=1 Tax=Rubrivirga sp. IMCC43871 TaxID=3391575 RepID=UPI00398FB7C5
MPRWTLVALGVAIWLVASLSAGGMGAAVATVMVSEFAARGGPSPSDVVDAEDGEIESQAMGETRPYTVHLPDFYARDTDERYPVWVVLDGSWNGPMTAEVARTFERAGLAPGHLVVAVENVARGRNTDLLPPGRTANGAEADRMIALAGSGRSDATVDLDLGPEDSPMRTHFDRGAVADTPGWTAKRIPGDSHSATPHPSTALQAPYSR